MRAYPAVVPSVLLTLSLSADVGADAPAMPLPTPEPVLVARCQMDTWWDGARHRIDVEALYHPNILSAFSEPVAILQHKCWIQLEAADSGRSYRFMCMREPGSETYGVVLRAEASAKGQTRALVGSFIGPRGDVDVRCVEERTPAAQRIRLR